MRKKDMEHQKLMLQQAAEQRNASLSSQSAPEHSFENKDIIAFSYRKKWKIYFSFFEKDEFGQADATKPVVWRVAGTKRTFVKLDEKLFDEHEFLIRKNLQFIPTNADVFYSDVQKLAEAFNSGVLSFKETIAIAHLMTTYNNAFCFDDIKEDLLLEKPSNEKKHKQLIFAFCKLDSEFTYKATMHKLQVNYDDNT